MKFNRLERIKDENTKKMLIELIESLQYVFDNKLKTVVLYSSVAKGIEYNCNEY